MEEQPLQWIGTWDQAGRIIGFSLLGLAVLFYLIHTIRLVSTGDPKTKYDYINQHEVTTLWRVGVLIFLAGAALANSFLTEIGPMWLTIRMVTTTAVTVVVLVVLRNMLKFYYPFYMEKRLKDLRYKPRISPKSGKPMKLLSEEEEDVYLDEGMQAEENIFTVDYDVWIDEETGYTKIEKYSGHLHAEKCPECDYQTFKVISEELIKKPSMDEDGELIKHYECGYCGYKAAKNVRVAKLRNMSEVNESEITEARA